MNLSALIKAAFFLTSTLAWSPTDSYAPGPIACPANNASLLRNADGISSSEASWVGERHKNTDDALVRFLVNANMTDFDANNFVHNTLNRSINIAVAFSGGGYRAMLNGAGQLSALDNRTTGAAENGLGGLIDATTYLTGLSGGNWMVGTLAMNNWTSVQDILDNGTIWDLEHSMFAPGGINIFKTASYWKEISDDLSDKRDAGFNVSLTDAWGRALSHQFFLNYPNMGAALTWSTLRDADVFSNHSMPFPIVVTDGRTPGSTIIGSNSTVFEVSPFELGSWDPSLHSFVDVKYLGSVLDNGRPVNSSACIGGFDNAGFIMGTSSTLFNQFILQLNTTGITGGLYDLIHDFLSDVSKDSNDIAVYRPNPFYKSSSAGEESIVQADTLYLVDGGEDLQNVPLYPLLQPERDVDIILAFDNSADTNESWPNGASLVATYERQFSAQGNGTTFPYVPGQDTFLALNLTSKPTFFGCDSKNLTTLNADGVIPPLVVYMANRPFSYHSNTSTYKMSYSEDEKRGVINNGFEVATRNNLTLDAEWAACLGCAIIRRGQERQNISQSAQCQKCFSEYCWDGSLVAADTDVSLLVNFTSTGLTSGAENATGTSNTTNAAGSVKFGGSSMWQTVIYVLATLAVISFA
ncbi:hypothetical protein BABINDRAFT_159566 [Babjeviella inositovora NRRL Y-12698]|uniref:Lysophospholipase n=1 Tax=Babjeviella inositovora NRRL Y-12698 TaxID=984486 RepID=A0A1E3QZN7_9ASCO|nr:uncharacterized protein BABINDRAFT_159566 [Babjeviella inositovora NRRL Y-12698]ODQ83108.1 hypothetical protein BABINDRAFT_159566 [Babjeviella inositovora NRRL Y-12698]